VANPDATKKFGNPEFNVNRPSREDTKTAGYYFKDTCLKCGARRIDAQLGLEATPEEFVAGMVAVFREVWRVLKNTGCLFLNLGDSYAGTGYGNGTGHFTQRNDPGAMKPKIEVPNGLKPKDLCGIPWRVAFALQADGWWLRSDIIWSKPNPMPESVTDRPTKSHEYIFLLTKRASYFWDQEAVREEQSEATLERFAPGQKQRRSSVKNRLGEFGVKEYPTEQGILTNGRNLRTVWQMATQPYSGSHYATYPEELPLRCIKAGSSERGVCPVCGKPWERVVEKEQDTLRPKSRPVGDSRGKSASDFRALGQPQQGSQIVHTSTIGWRATCAHEVEPIPATVLDPFVGSGTTLRAAERLGRSGVGFDLSLQYLMENARERLNLAQQRLWI
jgi:DNA modification methylase